MSAILRTIIVDDELHARELLREYLGGDERFELVAVCENGFEAVKRINELRPDVVFLDIQMPKLNGFEVLELIDSAPSVVFVTAYDQYAVKAFDVNAIDYLLKPFSEERFARVLQKLVDGSATLKRKPQDVAGVLREGPLQRVAVRKGTQVEVIPIGSVDYISAEDDYVRLYSSGRSFLKQQPISEIETQLDAARFVRIHRSTIVNLEKLARVEPMGRDSRVVVLKDGTQLPVSRSGWVRLRELL